MSAAESIPPHSLPRRRRYSAAEHAPYAIHPGTADSDVNVVPSIVLETIKDLSHGEALAALALLASFRKVNVCAAVEASFGAAFDEAHYDEPGSRRYLGVPHLKGEGLSYCPSCGMPWSVIEKLVLTCD